VPPTSKMASIGSTAAMWNIGSGDHSESASVSR
jgi:hypothetical protein